MSETSGTILLETKTKQGKSGKPQKFLVARFEPPISEDVGYRKEADGHYPAKVLRDKNKDTKAVIYDRGMFGWSEAEREEAFVVYWREQADRIGYMVTGAMVVDHPEETVADEAIEQ